MGELAQIGWDQFIVIIVDDIVAIMVRAYPPLKPIIVLFRTMTQRWEASDDTVPEWMLQPM